MNAQLPLPRQTATTIAAEGLPRRAFTVAEVEAMVGAGVIAEDERFEMIGGELVPMSPKGSRHESIKIVLARHLVRTTPDTWSVAQETTLRLDERSFVEPDFCIYRRALDRDLRNLNGTETRLAIEIADLSIAYDLGRKIGIYATYGVPEVWVIDARALVTYVHRGLAASRYTATFDVPPNERAEATFATGVAFRVADLDLEPLT